MFYIKLEDDLSLVITQRDTLRRGDNLSKKVIYLIPKTVAELDTQTAIFYLSFVRADGIADIVTLEKLDEMYNESYYQFTFPITCKLTRFAGSVCTWMQIYDGSTSNPKIAKSGECILQVEDSKNMDDYFSDRIVTALYQHDKRMADKFAEVDEDIAENSTAIGENAEAISQNASAIAENTQAIEDNAEAIEVNANAIAENAAAIASNSEAIGQNADAIRANITALQQVNATLAQHASDIAANADEIDEVRVLVAEKADSLIFNSDDSTIQLTAGGTPIGAKVRVNASDGKLITSVSLTTDGELLIFFDDGSYANVGAVVGENGKVYVPHIDEHKVLTFTIEDEPGEIPTPTDLNPEDDWGDIDDSDVTTDYVWEGMEDEPTGGNGDGSDAPEWHDGI